MLHLSSVVRMMVLLLARMMMGWLHLHLMLVVVLAALRGRRLLTMSHHRVLLVLRLRSLGHHIGRVDSAELLRMTTTVRHGLLRLSRRWRRCGMMMDHVHIGRRSVLMMLLLNLDMMMLLLTIAATMHGRGAGGRLDHVRRRRLTTAHHSHSTRTRRLLMSTATGSSPAVLGRSAAAAAGVHVRRLLVVSAASVHFPALNWIGSCFFLKTDSKSFESCDELSKI